MQLSNNFSGWILGVGIWSTKLSKALIKFNSDRLSVFCDKVWFRCSFSLRVLNASLKDYRCQSDYIVTFKKQLNCFWSLTRPNSVAPFLTSSTSSMETYLTLTEFLLLMDFLLSLSIFSKKSKESDKLSSFIWLFSSITLNSSYYLS